MSGSRAEPGQSLLQPERANQILAGTVSWPIEPAARRKRRFLHLDGRRNQSTDLVSSGGTFSDTSLLNGAIKSSKTEGKKTEGNSSFSAVIRTVSLEQVSNVTIALPVAQAGSMLSLRTTTARTLLAFAVLAVDVVSLLLCVLYTLRPAPHFVDANAFQFASACSIPLLTAIMVLYALRLYDAPEMLKTSTLSRLVVSTSIAALTLPSILLLLGSHIEGFAPWLILYWTSSTIAIVLGRGLFKKIIFNHLGMHEALRPRIAIVGANEFGAQLLERLDRRSSDVNVIGLYDDSAPKGASSFAVQGTISDLVALAQKGFVERILIALPITTPGIAKLAREFQPLPIDVSIGVDSHPLQLSVCGADNIDDLVTLRVLECPLTPSDMLVKAISDKLLATIAGLFLLPLLLLVALAIKLDSNGPVLFRQMRYGYKNCLFEIYKFRTMRANCADPTGARQAHLGDPRITRIGHFLRKFSLDELPQLLNVLRGDMSIVGPRPHPVAMTAGGVSLLDAAEDYMVRHRVKPGMTGWAQVNGWRGETDTVEKLKQRTMHDTYYVKHWSLGFDLSILFRTVVTVLDSKNAV